MTPFEYQVWACTVVLIGGGASLARMNESYYAKMAFGVSSLLAAGLTILPYPWYIKAYLVAIIAGNAVMAYVAELDQD